jgi:hypothetical protein
MAVQQEGLDSLEDTYFDIMLVGMTEHLGR